MRRKLRLRESQSFSRSSRTLVSGRYVLIFFSSLTFMNINVIILQIEDVAGSDEVTVRRKFGNEQYVSCAKCAAGSDYLYDSIRLIFSIADLQTGEENFEAPENEDSSEDTRMSYPLRCSFTITKVCASAALRISALV
jgi:hypothetical protein